MTIRTSDLVTLGATAAEAYDECDAAQTQLDDAFGVPFKSAKDNLLTDIRIASDEGLDLSVFSGENSRFKYRQFNTNIVVRVSMVPTSHNKLEKLSEKIEKLEADLKRAKLQLKHMTEQLVLEGECDQVVDRINLAFTRLNK